MTPHQAAFVMLIGAVTGAGLGCWVAYSLAAAGLFADVGQAIVVGQVLGGGGCIAGMATAALVAVVVERRR
jgi:hypothetical protein